MRNRSINQEAWDSLETEEIRLLRANSMEESLNQWIQLQEAFEWQLQQTADLFGPERRKAIIELQDRLFRLNFR